MKQLLAAGAALMLATAVTPAFALNTAKADLNHDGHVTPQEMQQRKVAKLMRADRDGDGRVSRAEYQAMMDRRAQRHPSMKANKPGKDKFAKLDLNRDGFITPDEAAQAAQRKFARRAAANQGYAPAQANAGPAAPR